MPPPAFEMIPAPVGRSARTLLMLILLYSCAILVGLQLINDPDIWWHLRTGEWIVAHRAVPISDPFSTYGEGKPWIAYSWLFDVGIYSLYKVGGLRGILLYEFAASLAIVVALHRLLARIEPRPARAVALAALGFLAMTPILSPRSYLVSIASFVVVLDAVLRARCSGRVRPLLLLPVLFMVWANIHIQFVYGLLILAVATLDVALSRWWAEGSGSRLSLRAWLLVDVACVLATLLTPYHVRLYAVLRDLSAQTGVYALILELRSPQFRDLPDWVALALVLAAAFTLGRRPIERLIAFLSAVGVFVSFRSGRDVWFVVVCATLILAMSGRTDVSDAHAVLVRPVKRGTKWRAAVATVLAFSMLLARLSAARLDAKIKQDFPADAAQAIEQGRYVGPLYNHFNWGGYLIWRLPDLRVSMDGRSNIHGDERIFRSMRTWGGIGDWRSDPDLSAAGVVIAGSDTPLGSLLRSDHRFREVHADAVARVFVAVSPHAPPDPRR